MPLKIANASLAHPVREALRRYAALEARRAKVPRRIPVGDVVDGDVVKLSAERKHLTDVIKVVAYQAGDRQPHQECHSATNFERSVAKRVWAR